VVDTKELLQQVLDAFNEPAFVIGVDDYKIKLANKKFTEVYGKNSVGETCWKKLRKNQHQPCEFCTNPFLVDGKNQPTGIFYSAYKSDVTGKWYQCSDQALKWLDDKLVALKITQDITQLKEAVQKNLVLLQQNTELRRQVITLLDEERKKLARNLHDEIGQIGTAIKLNADYLLMESNQNRSQDEDAVLKDISKQAVCLLKLLKQICVNLDPCSVSTALTLQEMLENLFNDWLFRNRRITGEIEINLETLNDGLDSDIKTTVYHILQESLTNISKHSMATWVKLQCEVKENSADEANKQILELTVDDNGVGISEQNQSVGLGQLYMKERVVQVEGNLDIGVSSLGGVRVKVQIPV